MNVTLYEHQEVGVKWMLKQENEFPHCGLLADDMGLGKTIQTISTINKNPPSGGYRGTLIVAPVSLLSQWKEEILSKSTVPHRIGMYHGNERKDVNLDDFDIILTTYNCLAREHEPIDKIAKRKKRNKSRMEPYTLNRKCYGKLLRHVWYRVVLDESHTIKNHKTRAAHAARALSSRIRWCLSGTPVQNSMEEMKGLHAFLVHQEIQMLQESRQFIQNRTLRRLKEQVLDSLPRKTVKKIQLDLTEYERYVYNMADTKAKMTLKAVSSGKMEFSAVLVALLRMRQICNHTKLVDLFDENYSTKQLQVYKIIHSIRAKPGNKVVVFTQFTSMITELEIGLKFLGWKFLTYTGKMTREQRERTLKEFENDPRCNILLMSTKAGNVGLNLVSANHVILTDVWWNPFVDQQAMDRVHRIGQKRNVMIHILIIRNSIEERILEIQETKKEMFENIFGEGNVSNALNLRDIRKLLYGMGN